jgi:hypothetical protein
VNASGAVLALLGVWVIFQVLGGDALGRLGVTAAAGTPPVIAGSPGSGTVEPPGGTTPRRTVPGVTPQ